MYNLLIALPALKSVAVATAAVNLGVVALVLICFALAGRTKKAGEKGQAKRKKAPAPAEAKPPKAGGGDKQS